MNITKSILIAIALLLSITIQGECKKNDANPTIILERIVAESGKPEINEFYLEKSEEEKSDKIKVGVFGLIKFKSLSGNNPHEGKVMKVKAWFEVDNKLKAEKISNLMEAVVSGNNPDAYELTKKAKKSITKEGAKHFITDKIKFYDYEFEPVSSKNPLVFLMTKEGYIYQGGLGKVKDTITGKTYNLK